MVDEYEEDAICNQVWHLIFRGSDVLKSTANFTKTANWPLSPKKGMTFVFTKKYVKVFSITKFL